MSIEKMFEKDSTVEGPLREGLLPPMATKKGMELYLHICREANDFVRDSGGMCPYEIIPAIAAAAQVVSLKVLESSTHSLHEFEDQDGWAGHLSELVQSLTPKWSARVQKALSTKDWDKVRMVVQDLAEGE